MSERIGIIGGGIVGIALARSLVQRGLGEVTVFEKEDRLAAHQTGHNSGVVHAGLYYAAGSLKAQLCVAGREALRDYCLQKNLPYREAGKLVVAVDESELPALAEIEKRSRANGVPGLARIDGAARLHEIEPHVAGVAAVHSPHTAVVDFPAITEAMAQDVRTAGGTILLGREVVSLAVEGATVRVGTAGSEHVFDRRDCLRRPAVRRRGPPGGCRPLPENPPFPGRILVAEPGAERPGAGDDLPRAGSAVPFPRRALHPRRLRRRARGTQRRAGPRAGGIRVAHGLGEGHLGIVAVARRRPAGEEALADGGRRDQRSLVKALYYRKARRFIPGLTMSDLTAKTAAGVRAQAWGRDGSLLDDFAVDQIGPVTLLRNAPSPAATSCLAIADYLVEKYLQVRRP